MRACHVDPTAGHMGKSRTIYRIKERYMWHGVVKDVHDLVSGNKFSWVILLCSFFDMYHYVHRYLTVMFVNG